MGMQTAPTSPAPKTGLRILEWSLRLIRWLLYPIGLVFFGVFFRFIWPALGAPAIGAVVGVVIGLVAARGKAREMIPAFSLQAGHLLWFMLGFAVVGPLQWRLWVEVAILWVGLVCLVTVQHWWPAALLMIYQLIGFFVNRATVASLEASSPLQPAAVAHVVLRFLALILLATGLIGYFLRKQREGRPSPAVASPPVAAPSPSGATAASAAPLAVSERTIEELRRLAALAADGVISKEEFEAKKKQILGI